MRLLVSSTTRFSRHGQVQKLWANQLNANWTREINWWQDLEKRLDPVVVEPSAAETLTYQQSARIKFFLAAIRFTRVVGGTVAAAMSEGTGQLASVICWLPPHVQPTFSAPFRSGWLRALFRLGLTGILRRKHFKSTLGELYARLLSPLGYRKPDGGFVSIIGTDPSHAGHGYAASLLDWQIQRHQQQYPGAPVFLHTVSEFAQKVYERIGFVYLGRQQIDIGSRDQFGCRYQHPPEQESGKPEFFQRVLVRELR
jgi:GNAT superfamily N-acetyltransferase